MYVASQSSGAGPDRARRRGPACSRRGGASPSDAASNRARPAPPAEVSVVPIHVARARQARPKDPYAAARAAHPSTWRPEERWLAFIPPTAEAAARVDTNATGDD